MKNFLLFNIIFSSVFISSCFDKADEKEVQRDTIKSVEEEEGNSLSRHKDLSQILKDKKLVAYEKSESNHSLFFLKVLDQRRTHGGSWTCGYHSLKNAIVFSKLMEKHKEKTLSQEELDQLLKSLRNRRAFNKSFVGQDRNLSTSEDMSWYSFMKSHKNFIENDGILPGDQREILAKIKTGELYSPVINPPYIYAINSFGKSATTSDDLHLIVESIIKIRKSDDENVAITLSLLVYNYEHFITAALRKHSKTGKLQIYILDSENRHNSSINNNAIKDLIFWYNNLENKTKKTYAELFHSKIERFSQREESSRLGKADVGYILESKYYLAMKTLEHLNSFFTEATDKLWLKNEYKFLQKEIVQFYLKKKDKFKNLDTSPLILNFYDRVIEINSFEDFKNYFEEQNKKLELRIENL